MGCEVGQGEGEIFGTMFIEDCGLEGDYNLNPSFFVAEDREERLDITVQRGSQIEIRSDGMYVLVADTNEIYSKWLNQPIALSSHADALVQIVVYLNDSCEIERDETPVSLSATSGTIMFDEIYAREQSDNEDISATLSDVKLEDASDPEMRHGMLSGYFRLNYSRGRPAQRFP